MPLDASVHPQVVSSAATGLRRRVVRGGDVAVDGEIVATAPA
jgi:hypothetical protein